MSNVNLLTGNDGSNVLQGSSGADLIYGYNPDGPQSQVTSITATRVASGLDQPLFAVTPPGDTTQLFIVEKTGLIEILDLGTGQILPSPFLDVSGQIVTVGEEGLLGLAFDPNYAQNGFIYINLVNPSGDTEIRRYHVSADPNAIDPASATQVISIDQPNASNHKGGWLGFGPDGYLYAALGDGGGGGDTFHNGQNMDSLLGKMLRLDVHADAFPGDAGRNYAIPADNPFVGVAGADEIWALGLRNPWRPSFDRATGDFYIADVGQDTREEIDIGVKGANYGWNAFEGPSAFPGGDAVSGGTLTFPIYSYDHTVGHAITGGYVYRGPSDGLQGQYFFADFIDDRIFTLHFDGTSWVATERTSQITTDVGSIDSPSSFGQDGLGNLYVVDFDGEVFRLTPNVNSADQGDDLSGLGGNDLLFGGAGNDTLRGGDGNDELQGGAGADMLFGNADNDLLFGAGGDDTLDGGAGADTMVGGVGNDVYFVDSTGDTVVENPNEGNDVVYSTIGYTLPANVDALVLMAGAGPINGDGNGADNYIAGNSNDNVIDGKGGDDTMIGGAGNDIYVVDSTSDLVMENPNEGNDIVYASVDYTIGGNIESVVLIEGAGNINAAGNNADNALVGNFGNNTLDGKSGDDTMIGGAGNDIYYVDSTSDLVIENPNEGNDIVYASVDYTIGANIESVVLIEGAGNINAAGSNTDNALIGNSSDNTLDGKGGNDTMIGGAGNDIYFVDSTSDLVVENPNEGNDIVYASVDYTIGPNVESLVMVEGAGNINGSGSNVDNAIVGNAGDNVIDGKGGHDLLTGNAGNDTFVFASGQASGDAIVDFNGNGASAGDSFRFTGFGTAGQGATFTQIGATNQWQIHSGLDAHDEVITLLNGPTVHASDYVFV
jgi:Ca2+-binding RTX toxin-like protein